MDTRESALIVPVPAAEPAVGVLREELDASAPLGVPAHITILYPFMSPELLNHAVIDDLTTMFSQVARFDFALTSVGWFDTEIVYLAPRPEAAFKRLTALVTERWPDWPPYGGQHPDPTPHLTVGDSEDYASMVAAAAAVGPLLPVASSVAAIDLIVGDVTPGSWTRIASFPLDTNRPVNHRA